MKLKNAKKSCNTASSIRCRNYQLLDNELKESTPGFNILSFDFLIFRSCQSWKNIDRDWIALVDLLKKINHDQITLINLSKRSTMIEVLSMTFEKIKSLSKNENVCFVCFWQFSHFFRKKIELLPAILCNYFNLFKRSKGSLCSRRSLKKIDRDRIDPIKL